MLQILGKVFSEKLNPNSGPDENSRLQAYELAGAALLAELMEIDHQLDARETETFYAVLKETFSLPDEELQEIVKLARQQAREYTSLYEFTRAINDNFAYEDKVRLVENLWRIAFADEKLDKYEEGLIRRVCDLIHVSHSDFIRTKLQVRNSSA